MERLVYIDEKIIEHRHWVVGAPKDALYLRNDSLMSADKEVYEARKADRFDMPTTWLSVLICSLPSRKPQLDRLLDHLWAQIISFTREVHSAIEVIVDSREAISIGEKRQALLRRARGSYVAFVDDDDWVAHNYIRRIVSALANDPKADCAALNGVMTTAGAVPEPFHNTIKNTEWYSKDGVHYRTATHLSPVRRDLALKAGFPSISYGEDHQYSVALRPLLKHEVSTGDAPLYFYYYQPGK